MAKIFKDEASITPEAMSLISALFPHSRNNVLLAKVMGELFLKPYQTSRELTQVLGISLPELRKIYSEIQGSPQMNELFELSPYPYLIKTIGSLAQDEQRTLQILTGTTPDPLTKTMELFISQVCNADCKFCYRDGGGYPDNKILSTEDFVKIVNEFADLDGGYLDVCGGLEPLLGPAIRDVLETGLKRKLNVCLYTNGIALDKPEVKELLLKIDKIRVSFNAYDRESYKDVLQVDKFDAVINNITQLIKARDAAGAKVRIGVSFVVSKENYTKIPVVVSLAQEMGVDFLDLRNIHVTNHGGFSSEQKAELHGILEEVRQGVIEKRYGRMGISIADTFNVIVQESGLLRSMTGEFVDALVNFRVTVAPSGRVYALNVIAQPTREDPRYLLGDLDAQTGLAGVLKGQKHLPFEPELLLPHDISLVVALPKLKADLELGIGLKESPFTCCSASSLRAVK